MEYEKKSAVVADVLLQNSEGKFLFLKRSASSSWEPGKWQLPGGKMDWGESPEEALRREVLEEAGYGLPEKLDFITLTTLQLKTTKMIHYHILQLVYMARFEGGEIKISEEHEDMAWWTLDEAKTNQISEDVTVLLEKGLQALLN